MWITCLELLHSDINGWAIESLADKLTTKSEVVANTRKENNILACGPADDITSYDL